MDKNAIKIHILHCGTITIPANMAYIKDSALHRVTLPVSVYLIEHPVHGKILVETGLSADCNEVMPKYLRDFYRPHVEKGLTAVSQLAAMGIRPEDIDLVLITHNDVDHTCALKDFAGRAKRFGEDNIVGFYVHLDETNPHIHCSAIPMDNERGRISWRAVFGKDKYQMAAIFRRLHDDLENEVSQKWGLERGNDIATTKARHRSISEYRHDLITEVSQLQTTKEDLLKQIHRAEIKLKGISTMIANEHTDEGGKHISLELN